MVPTIFASPRLHAQPRLETCKAIRWDAIDFVIFTSAISDAQVLAIGVFTGKIEKVDAGEDREEAAEEGDGVDRVGGVEAAEEDEGGDECAGRE